MHTSLALALIAAILPLAVAPAAAQTAEPQEVLATWTRDGFAEARDLAAADFDGDGSQEIVYGGRGVAVLDEQAPQTHRTRLTIRPVAEDPANVLDGGDNAWTTGVEPVEATGDGVPDLLMTTSDTDAYLVDGATGEHRWHNPRTGAGLSFGFALVDADDDAVPDLFPTGGKQAFSGATGEPLWTAPIGKDARHTVTAELDGQPGRDVLVAHNPAGPTAPSLYGISSRGELLWEFAAVTVIHSLAAADLDGDGIDEAIVGNHNGLVLAVDAGGLRWAAAAGAGFPVEAVAAGDADGDGRDDVYASVNLGYERFAAAGIGPEGGVRWTHPLDRPAGVLEVTPGRLLVGTGLSRRDTGSVLSLATGPAEVQRERWRVATEGQVRAITTATHQGQEVVAIGGDEALLRLVEADTGGPVWQWTSGDALRTAAAGDVDGDDRDEYLTGDDRGHVMLVDHAGDVRWTATPSPGFSSVLGSGFLTGAGGADAPAVVAAATRYAPTDGSSTLAAWTAGGQEAWSVTVPGAVEALEVADLNGDGADDVVLGEWPSLHPEGDGCFVSAYDGPTGEQLWRQQISGGCLVAHIAVADGLIGYGDQSIFGAITVAALSYDGTVKWRHTVDESTGWLDILPHGIVFGGYASEARGHVTLRALADGSVVWKTYFGSGRDDQGQVAAGGASRYGRGIADLGGDGQAEILTTSDDGTVALLGGHDGSVRWSTVTEPQDTHPTMTHSSGPVAVVPGAPPVIVTAEYATGQPIRGDGFVLGLDGEMLGTFPLLREARDIAVGRLSDGRYGAAVAAGLSLTLIAPTAAPPGSEEPTEGPSEPRDRPGRPSDRPSGRPTDRPSGPPSDRPPERPNENDPDGSAD